MKKIIAVFLVCILMCFSSVSCSNEKSEETRLSQSNITEYVNIQLVFGEVDQNTFKNTSVSLQSPTSITYSTCMCYVIVSPKGEYKFENANLTINISHALQGILSSPQEWNPVFDDGTTILGADNEMIYLDKNGYGIASVYFETTGNEHHPSISYKWEPKVVKASGTVISGN